MWLFGLLKTMFPYVVRCNLYEGIYSQFHRASDAKIDFGG